MATQKASTVGKAKHTIQSVGDKVESFHGEFKAFVKRAETKTDEGLAWWRSSQWSVVIGLVLLIVVMMIGDLLGIARLL